MLKRIIGGFSSTLGAGLMLMLRISLSVQKKAHCAVNTTNVPLLRQVFFSQTVFLNSHA